MPKLTKRSVETLEVRKSDYIVFDSEVNGFGIRVMPSGRKSYIVQYRQGGRTRRMVLGRHGTLTSEEARKEAIKRLGEVAKGEDPSLKRGIARRAPNVAALCDRFIEEHALPHLKPKTAYDYIKTIDYHIRPRLGNYKVADLKRKDMAEIHHALRDTPFQANRVIMLMSKMCNLAELWGLRQEGTNPCRMVPKFKEKSRERYLANHELQRLGEVFSEALETVQESVFVIAAYKLLLLTGCRLTEIQTLRWGYLTPTHIELPDSKTGKRRIPLSSVALSVLHNLPRTEGNPYVIEGKFPNSHITDLQHPWRRLRQKAGLDRVRIHDLRHTYASLAVMNGVDLLTVGKILGHSNYQTTMRYAHLADEGVRLAADRISGLMAGSIASDRSVGPNLRIVG